MSPAAVEYTMYIIGCVEVIAIWIIARAVILINKSKF